MRSPTLQREPKSATGKPEQRLAAKPENTQQPLAPGRMFIVGRVLDPEGKPVVGATVMAYARVPVPGHADDLRRSTRFRSGMAKAMDRASFAWMRRARRHPEMMVLAPSHLRRDSVPAGLRSMSTPSSPQRIFRFGANRQSRRACSTCKAGLLRA